MEISTYHLATWGQWGMALLALAGSGTVACYVLRWVWQKCLAFAVLVLLATEFAHAFDGFYLGVHWLSIFSYIAVTFTLGLWIGSRE